MKITHGDNLVHSSCEDNENLLLPRHFTVKQFLLNSQCPKANIKRLPNHLDVSFSDHEYLLEHTQQSTSRHIYSWLATNPKCPCCITHTFTVNTLCLSHSGQMICFQEWHLLHIRVISGGGVLKVTVPQRRWLRAIPKYYSQRYNTDYKCVLISFRSIFANGFYASRTFRDISQEHTHAHTQPSRHHSACFFKCSASGWGGWTSAELLGTLAETRGVI